MNKLAAGLAGILVVNAIAAGYLWFQLHAERDHLAALQARVSGVEKARQSVAAQPASAATNAVATATAGAEPSATGEKLANAPTTKVSTNAMAGAVSAMLSQPDMLRQELERQFPDIVKELDLLPAEADKFYALLAKQTAGSVESAFSLVGGSADAAAQQEAMRKMLETQARNDKEMTALLGSRRHQQWQEYQGTVAARQQVEQLRIALGSGENLLSEARIKPLVSALGSETARLTRETNAKLAADSKASKSLMEQQLNYTVENNQHLAGVASSYLTTPQLDKYKQILAQQELLSRAMMSPSRQGSTANGAK